MANEQYPVPERPRQDGPDAHAIGVWVLGEVLFPPPGLDPSWQGFIKHSAQISSASYIQQLMQGGTTSYVRHTAQSVTTTFARSVQ